MVYIPEPFVVLSSRFFHGSEYHGHERYHHDVAGRAGTGTEVDDKPAFETEVFGHGETGKVNPVGDGVDPGEKHDGPSDEFVESNVFVEINDAVEGCATEEGDETATDGYMLNRWVVGESTEENEGYIDVERQCRGPSDGICDAEYRTCI
jgi:hypothetical protein